MPMSAALIYTPAETEGQGTPAVPQTTNQITQLKGSGLPGTEPSSANGPQIVIDIALSSRLPGASVVHSHISRLPAIRLRNWR